MEYKQLQEMEWISVKDRLPDTIGACLVCTEKKIAWAFFNSNGHFCAENVYILDVTHWMPLPKPPKSREG